MKTKKDLRFSLNKETISNLNLFMMSQVIGGTGTTGGTEETELECPPKKPTSPCQTR